MDETWGRRWVGDGWEKDVWEDKCRVRVGYEVDGTYVNVGWNVGRTWIGRGSDVSLLPPPNPPPFHVLPTLMGRGFVTGQILVCFFFWGLPCQRYSDTGSW